MRSARLARSRRKSLRVQADVPHTFGPLLIPLAALLIGYSAFQLHRAISQPLESDAASVLFHSVLLASGLLLAGFLVRAVRTVSAPPAKPEQIIQPIIAEREQSQQKFSQENQGSSRPFHRFYVDDVRISR